MSTMTSAVEKDLSSAPRVALDSGAGTLPVDEAGGLRRRVVQKARQVRERALEKETEFEDAVRAHPVKAVLVASGVGAGLGLLIGAMLARR
jgi:ElaB/YqjD/DUF883 family membrane-anchored ribosome-binding protein